MIHDALRLLEEREELRRLRLAEMRGKIAAGLASPDGGEGIAREEAFDELLTGRC